MVVSKEIIRLEHSSLELTVTIGKDDIKKQYDELIKSYSKSIQIKGFRKGMVPRNVLELKFGDAFRAETLGTVMEKALEELFASEDFAQEDRPLPYSTPAVKEEPKFELDKDLTFTVKYDCFPEVKVGTWKGVEIEVPAASVGSEDIDRELEQLRDRNAIVIDRNENDTVAMGNVVTVSYAEIAEDGSSIPSTERKDFVFTIGAGQNPYHFDDELIGMKKNGTKTFDKVYPADFADPSLAGKTKKISVSISALKEKQLPELDDDFAQDISEKYKTLDDLKAMIKEHLEKNLENTLRGAKTNAFLEKVLETTSIDVPESMIRIESESRLRELSRRFNMNVEQLDSMLASSGKDSLSLMDEWRPDIEKAVKSRLIVETLIKEQGISVEDSDLEAEFENMAKSMNIGIDEVKKYYEKENMKEYVREEIRERKFFDMVFTQITVKKGKTVKYLDLVGNNG